MFLLKIRGVLLFSTDKVELLSFLSRNRGALSFFRSRRCFWFELRDRGRGDFPNPC